MPLPDDVLGARIRALREAREKKNGASLTHEEFDAAIATAEPELVAEAAASDDAPTRFESAGRALADMRARKRADDEGPKASDRVLAAARELYGESGVAVQKDIAAALGFSGWMVSTAISKLRAEGRWPYEAAPKGGIAQVRPPRAAKPDLSCLDEPVVRPKPSASPQPEPADAPPAPSGDRVRDVLLIIEAFERIEDDDSRANLAFWVFKRYGGE